MPMDSGGGDGGAAARETTLASEHRQHLAQWEKNARTYPCDTSVFSCNKFEQRRIFSLGRSDLGDLVARKRRFTGSGFDATSGKNLTRAYRVHDRVQNSRHLLILVDEEQGIGHVSISKMNYTQPNPRAPGSAFPPRDTITAVSAHKVIVVVVVI